MTESVPHGSSIEGAAPSAPVSGRAVLARYLRQREELGTGGLHLVEMAPGEALSVAGSKVGSAPSPPAMVPPGAKAPSFGGGPSTRGGGAGVGRESVGKVHAMDGGLATGFETLEALHAACAGCTRCGLAQTRTQVVVADGNPKARLMVVGEAPGAHEDQQGRPFVGAAGKLLDLLLQCVDLSRAEDVFICNVIKCRPPGNRNPTAEEVEACSPWLRRQVGFVSPRAILAVGTFAGQLLSGSDAPLGRLRGEVRSYEGIPMVVTYHPAALLRNSGWILPTWEDLQQLRQLLDTPS